jgi:hypothetical protein
LKSAFRFFWNPEEYGKQTSSNSPEKERVNALERIKKVLAERYRNSTAKKPDGNRQSRPDAALLRAIRNLEVLLGRYPRGELLPGARLPEVTVPPVDIPGTVLLMSQPLSSP